MKYFEEQALRDEFSYATEDGSVLTYKDIEAILDHFDEDPVSSRFTPAPVPVLKIELAPQEETDGLKRKYVVLKSDTGEVIENCFVLRPDKDPAAIAALKAYAGATDNLALAEGIRAWMNILQAVKCLS